MLAEREWVDPETGWAYRIVTCWMVKRLQCRHPDHDGLFRRLAQLYCGWFDCPAAEGHESGLRWFLPVVDGGSKGDG